MTKKCGNPTGWVLWSDEELCVFYISRMCEGADVTIIGGGLKQTHVPNSEIQLA